MEPTASTVTKNTTSAHRGKVQRGEAGTDRAHILATDNCDGDSPEAATGVEMLSALMCCTEYKDL